MLRVRHSMTLLSPISYSSLVPAIRFETQSDGSILLSIKAVPGASRNQVVGALGDRLKIRIAAPPEGGKANKSICETLARALGIKSRQVEIHAGHGHAEKAVKISGVDVKSLEQFLATFDS